MATTIESISLGYREGTSDKVYNVQLNRLAENDKWSVSFSYGRRTGTLKSGLKCSWVGYTTAKAAYDKLISEKRAKGYRTIATTSKAKTKPKAEKPKEKIVQPTIPELNVDDLL